ncbi:MAG: ABC-F family ATP-binding cassette domain-containing protein, partial [Bacteroidaceae bacterium]|nr:ABC-F family ATP-binding cassette domain-containing protein [Bacteroidaceae bacterium]
DMGNGQRLSVSQFLQHFLFEPEQQYNYVGKLSGGEKRRLYLCTVLMKAPNFLILDEPTNDLDIITLQILEDYLAKFKGCLIVVSHDRYFMDKVVDHLLVFEGDGRVKDFPGNYREYRAKKEEEEAMRKASKTNAPTSSASDTKNMNRDGTQRKRKMSYKEKKEFEQLEKDLAMLEAEKRSIEEGLSSGKLSVEQITQMSKRLPILQDELDEKEMRWLELSEME